VQVNVSRFSDENGIVFELQLRKGDFVYQVKQQSKSIGILAAEILAYLSGVTAAVIVLVKQFEQFCQSDMDDEPSQPVQLPRALSDNQSFSINGGTRAYVQLGQRSRGR